MKAYIVTAPLGIVLLFATTSFAQQVKTDYDRGADFNQYKTYSWEKVQTRDSLWVDRIMEAVNGALAAKGWMPVQSGGDVAIVAVETTQNQQTLDTFYDGLGGGWRWRGFGGFGESTTNVENYKVGTLVIDLFDTKTKGLIWRGSVSDALSNKSDKNIRTSIRGCKRCSIIFLRAKRNS